MRENIYFPKRDFLFESNCVHLTWKRHLFSSQSFFSCLCSLFSCVKKVNFYFIYFFVVTFPFWLFLLLSLFFGHIIHLVFRWTMELSSRLRTMAQTLSPRRLPLDQGASPLGSILMCHMWHFWSLWSKHPFLKLLRVVWIIS